MNRHPQNLCWKHNAFASTQILNDFSKSQRWERSTRNRDERKLLRHALQLCRKIERLRKTPKKKIQSCPSEQASIVTAQVLPQITYQSEEFKQIKFPFPDSFNDGNLNSKFDFNCKEEDYEHILDSASNTCTLASHRITEIQPVQEFHECNVWENFYTDSMCQFEHENFENWTINEDELS